jgi:hypothetical protein
MFTKFRGFDRSALTEDYWQLYVVPNFLELCDMLPT